MYKENLTCKRCGKKITLISENSPLKYCFSCRKEMLDEEKNSEVQNEIKKRNLLDVTSDNYLVERESVEEWTRRVNSKPKIDIEKQKKESIERFARIDLSQYEHLIGENNDNNTSNKK